MEQAGRTDVVIASRFHNVVCALNVGRPVISIGYAAKNDDLLQEMSLGSYCQHIERLDIPVLEQQLERLIRERDGAAVRVRAVAERYRAELREQEHRLLHHICGPAHRVGESAPLHTAAAE